MISVIMPCYNAGKYIKEAIESVLNQSYNDWELIIVNDGSTDDSLSVAESFSDKRIHIFSQPNSGACVARNKGIAEAKGEYIKFLDADDLLNKDCLKVQVKQISKLTDNQIPFGDYINFDENNSTKTVFKFSEHDEFLRLIKRDAPFCLFKYWQLLISSPLHRKELLVRCNGFDSNLRRGQESDLHFRLALLCGVEFIYYPNVTFSYREYNSVDRITAKGRVDKNMMNDFYDYYFDKYEKLLVSRYGRIPTSFVPYFIKEWYKKSRLLYFENNIEKGEIYKKKIDSIITVSIPLKIRLYYFIGSICGYHKLEFLINKNNS